MCLQLTSDKSDKSVSFSLISSQYYIIALLLLIALQELNPPSLPMCIKTFCPKIDKQCLPTRIYLNDIRVKTLFIIYFFQHNPVIPYRNMLIPFMRIYPIAYIKRYHVDLMRSKSNDTEKSEPIFRTSTCFPYRYMFTYRSKRCVWLCYILQKSKLL